MREGDWCKGRRGYKQFVEEHSYSPSAWQDNLLPLLAQSSAGFPLSAQAQPPLPLTQPLVLRLSKPLFTYCGRRMLKFSIFDTMQDGKLRKCSDKDQMNLWNYVHTCLELLNFSLNAMLSMCCKSLKHFFSSDISILGVSVFSLMLGVQ